jgi:predicted SAM-dependent methyltransferase
VITIKHALNGGIKRLIIHFYPNAFPLKGIQTPDDPERAMLFPYCKGLGIDVGCGSKKTHPLALGVDLTPKGQTGKYGSERRQISEADICTSGDNLYMLADNSLDYVVARHNLEHYTDPIKTLKEWKRVLRKGGIMGVVVPDDEALDTIKLDPTHKHAFTKESFANMLAAIGGFKIVKIKTCVPMWSFVCIAKKVD